MVETLHCNVSTTSKKGRTMFLQEATPDTVTYMLMGYAVFFIFPALFIASLWWRQRNLQKDLEVLDELKREDKA